MNETIQMLPAEGIAALPEIYSWGIEVIRFIQRLETPALTSLMKIITALGNGAVYIPLILFLFWCICGKIL